MPLPLLNIIIIFMSKKKIFLMSVLLLVVTCAATARPFPGARRDIRRKITGKLRELSILALERTIVLLNIRYYFIKNAYIYYCFERAFLYEKNFLYSYLAITPCIIFMHGARNAKDSQYD